MTPPTVSVVIVAYRTPALVDRCLATLASAVEIDHEIVVVDNSPGDGTNDIVRERHPGVTLVENPENVGFAAAVNIGARRSRGRYLLLLNPDTELHHDAISELVAFADERPHHMLYGGRTRLTDGRSDPRSCFGLPTLWSTLCWAFGLSALLHRSQLFDPESLGRWERDTVRVVPVITGCLLLVTRTFWESLGGMDERYFLFGEDVDFSLRAAAAGATPVIVPDATIVHHFGASTSSRPGRLVLVLAGKATVFRGHWSARRAQWGTRLLVAGIGVRLAAYAALSVLTGGGYGRCSHLDYRAVWAERGRWAGGYPMPPQGPSSTVKRPGQDTKGLSSSSVAYPSSTRTTSA